MNWICGANSKRLTKDITSHSWTESNSRTGSVTAELQLLCMQLATFFAHIFLLKNKDTIEIPNWLFVEKMILYVF